MNWNDEDLFERVCLVDEDVDLILIEFDEIVSQLARTCGSDTATELLRLSCFSPCPSVGRL